APPQGWSAPFVIIQRAFERGFSKFRQGYRNLLSAILGRRWTFAIIFLLFCLATFALGPQLGQDFFPKVDGGQIRLHLRGRSGTRFEDSAQFLGRVKNPIQEGLPKSELAAIPATIGIPFSGIALRYSNSVAIGTSDANILISLTHDHPPTDKFFRELRSRLN